MLSLTSSFQRIILPECWYRITLDRTQKANLMSNSNICDIRFITNIHIWFCRGNRLYRKPNWFNWNSINKSISIMSLLLMLRQGICIFLENKKSSDLLRARLRNTEFAIYNGIYRKAANGDDWAGHKNATFSLSGTLNRWKSSPYVIFGAVNVIGSVGDWRWVSLNIFRIIHDENLDYSSSYSSECWHRINFVTFYD